MKLYFSPLEGITTYIYRNTHERFFGACDAYFTPFITPSDNEKIGRSSSIEIVNYRDYINRILYFCNR